MNKRDLIKILDGLSDDTPIIVDDGDHSFRPSYAYVSTVVQEGRGRWGEDGGQDGSRVKAVIIE